TLSAFEQLSPPRCLVVAPGVVARVLFWLRTQETRVVATRLDGQPSREAGAAAREVFGGDGVARRPVSSRTMARSRPAPSGEPAGHGGSRVGACKRSVKPPVECGSPLWRYATERTAANLRG